MPHKGTVLDLLLFVLCFFWSLMLLKGATSTPESGTKSTTEKGVVPTTTVVQKVC